MVGRIATVGADLVDLIEDQSDWSQATFGTDKERGPLGALRHLAKEAAEAEAAWVKLQVERNASDLAAPVMVARTAVGEELADCLLLILDASRRAGVKPLDLIHAAQAKMKKNKARTWPKSEPDTPCEHVKS